MPEEREPEPAGDGWMRHIVRDQAIWVAASILGMALPCMMSLEFIRNATVTGDRVAAMTAAGIADRYPSFGWLFLGHRRFSAGSSSSSPARSACATRSPAAGPT